MPYIIRAIDKAQAEPIRIRFRDEHMAYLHARVQAIIAAGPLLDGQGRSCGALLIVDAADQQAAEGFIAQDPYAREGLFDSVEVRPWKKVFFDHRAVA